MKGYCDCGSEIDEVEFTDLGMCLHCYTISTYNESYKQGYTDALFDICAEDDNDGDWDFPDGYYNMNDDYD